MALPSTNTITALFLVIDDSGQMAKIKKEMENAIDEDYNFSVPLIVDANSAKNWNDAH